MTYSTEIETRQPHYLSTLGFLNCVSKNMDNTLLKLCKIIFPSVHLLGLHDVLICELHYRK